MSIESGEVHDWPPVTSAHASRGQPDATCSLAVRPVASIESGYRGSEMAHKTELDAVDRKILRLLATDGRSSYQALADEVGLSRPAVMERVKRLEEAGYITGYGARSIAPKPDSRSPRSSRCATPNPTTSATSHGCARWKNIPASWSVTTSRVRTVTSSRSPRPISSASRICCATCAVRRRRWR